MWGLISKDIYLTILKGMWILSQGPLFVTEEEPWLEKEQQTTLFHDQGFEKEQQAEVPHNCFHFFFGFLSVVIRAEG